MRISLKEKNKNFQKFYFLKVYLFLFICVTVLPACQFIVYGAYNGQEKSVGYQGIAVTDGCEPLCGS